MLVASTTEFGLILGVALAGIIVFGVGGMFAWIAYLVYCDSQNREISMPRFRLFPRLPWSKSRKLGAMKLDTEIAEQEFELVRKRALVNDLYDKLNNQPALEAGTKATKPASEEKAASAVWYQENGDKRRHEIYDR